MNTLNPPVGGQVLKSGILYPLSFIHSSSLSLFSLFQLLPQLRSELPGIGIYQPLHSSINLLVGKRSSLVL